MLHPTGMACPTGFLHEDFGFSGGRTASFVHFKGESAGPQRQTVFSPSSHMVERSVRKADPLSSWPQRSS